MSNSLTEDCPSCGSSADARAFVNYQPDPNDAQEECEWAASLQTLHALVCTECGYVLGVVDAQDPERAAEESENQFRIERELE